MENQKFVAIDELAFNPLPIRDSVKNKLFQTPEDQRRWSVQQIQSSEGTMSWQIQVDVQDGSKKLYPLADGTILNSGGLPAQGSLAARGSLSDDWADSMSD
ncbi:MAG: hypothetical protein HC936_14175 [Leptolyngbyaceae cyanobacterium SU_3_3]|nr:hypothetical protein [Leptolyngbyaceae cyanobacterium SU_3_3]